MLKPNEKKENILDPYKIHTEFEIPDLVVLFRSATTKNSKCQCYAFSFFFRFMNAVDFVCYCGLCGKEFSHVSNDNSSQACATFPVKLSTEAVFSQLLQFF